MKRVQAWMLLAALLAGLLGEASALAYSPCPCCPGTICSMQHETTQRGKKLCSGTRQSPDTCICAATQPNQAAIQPVIPKAAVDALPALFLPVVMFRQIGFDPGPIANRSVPPPDQPPRQ
jgi:hypothetical protein